MPPLPEPSPASHLKCQRCCLRRPQWPHLNGSEPGQPHPGQRAPVGAAGSKAGHHTSVHVLVGHPHSNFSPTRGHYLFLCLPTCYTPLVVWALPPPSPLSSDPQQSNSTLPPAPVLLPHCRGFTNLPLGVPAAPLVATLPQNPGSSSTFPALPQLAPFSSYIPTTATSMWPLMWKTSFSATPLSMMKLTR